MNKNNTIAYCGLDCSKCEAYLATINNDNELRIKVAKKWSDFNNFEIKPEFINCEGCKGDGIKTLFCDSLCEIRKCAKENKMSHCGHCSNLVKCKKIKMIIDHNNEALNNLKCAKHINYLLFKDFSEIYDWFKNNHKTEKEMFCVVKRGDPKKAGETLSYYDAVNAALCFGWIDSTLRNIEGVLVQRFSPRGKKSHWTDLNVERCKILITKGLMTEDGIKAIPKDKL